MMLTPPFIRENSERREYKRQKNHAELSASPVLQSAALNRLLTAAVVNYRFCSLLLSDPIQAVANGYNGETFELAPEEVQLLRAIKASSLRDFATQLLTKDLAVEKTWLATKSTAFLNKTYAAA